MTAVNIRGTFKRDSRPENGLEALAEELCEKEFSKWVVVGVVELVKVVKTPGEAPVPTVNFVSIEPLSDEAAQTARDLLTAARKARGRESDAPTLFDAAADATKVEDGDDGAVSERQPDAWLDEGEADKPKRGRR